MSGADVVRGVYESLRAGDVSAVLATFAPAIEWNEAENFPYADGNPYIGPEAVVEGVLARLGSDWDRFDVIVERLLDAGNDVVALGRYQGRHAGTGADIDAQFAHVWRVEEGKLTRFQQYADTAQAQAVVGGAAM